MCKTLNILLFLFLSFCSFGYTQKVKDTYSVCEGTINIFRSNSFTLQFLGHKGNNNRFSQYPALKHITSGNQIWFSFVAPTNGTISLELSSKRTGLKLIVFDAAENNVCTDISSGNAEIKRLLEPADVSVIGLNEHVTEAFQYPLTIEKGKTLHFVVVADHDHTEYVQMDFRFHSDDPGFSEYKSKEVNLKKDRESPSLIVQVRDKETGKPLVADLILKGVRKYDGMYNVSDLVFDISRKSKIEFYCDHEGYFFKDSSNIAISSEKDNLILIELEPVRSGKSVQIGGIEFVPGTSQITESSIPKLNRLKDFLIINSMLNIEIQGHVYEPGEDNSFSGQKMSEARAKRIMKYLTDHGISRERLSAVGYGNTAPIYKNPKTYSEEQANRRVEILIK